MTVIDPIEQSKTFSCPAFFLLKCHECSMKHLNIWAVPAVIPLSDNQSLGTFRGGTNKSKVK